MQISFPADPPAYCGPDLVLTFPAFVEGGRVRRAICWKRSADGPYCFTAGFSGFMREPAAQRVRAVDAGRARTGARRRRRIGEGAEMAVSGELHEADWSVAIETAAADGGGYQCRIHVTHKAPDGACERAFAHSRIFASEREAALEGLRTGMTWIEMKKSDTFSL